MLGEIKFTESNYPKSYGTIKKEYYRLNKFLDLPEKELEKLENQFWNFVNQKAKNDKPRKKYQKYKFLNSGWEWSVFVKNKNSLIKIPAGIFTEVNDPKYLENTKFAYNKILNYFPNKFVAKTKFKRENNLNIMEQEYIFLNKENKSTVLLNKDSANKKMLRLTKKFLSYALKMLSNYYWLPDLDVKKTDQGFSIRNVVFSQDNFIPKIIDFTAYYDVYRLYPQRTKYEVKEKAKRIKELIEWINNLLRLS